MRMTFLRSCPGFVIIAFAATSFLPPPISSDGAVLHWRPFFQLDKKNEAPFFFLLPHVTVRIEMAAVHQSGCFAGGRESGVADT